jgi:16S rRNA (uracil1498-N3)-methyltransferase
MQLFYQPDVDQQTELVFFSREESRHIVRVLRKKSGDRLFLTDGKGALYEAEILDASDKRCQARICGKEQKTDRKGYRLHIAMAPTKMNDRFEWFLEKATEIGIDEITPILCEHSERKKVNLERYAKVIQSAAKQSLKFVFPRLNPLQKFDDLIGSSDAETRLIAHCHDGQKENLNALVDGKEDVLVLIGPEGDFSQREIDLAEKSGFKGLNLGTGRLRTETAGVVVCSNLAMIKEFL